jgi:hypothetical protein
METMEGKQPRARRSFTPEFKAEIVELCQRGDRSIGRSPVTWDLTKTAVREWVRQAPRQRPLLVTGVCYRGPGPRIQGMLHVQVSLHRGGSASIT